MTTQSQSNVDTPINATLNIGGKVYLIEDLSETAKKLLLIHGKWSQEVEDTRLTVAKTEAALRDLAREIIETIGKDNTKEYIEEAVVTRPIEAESVSQVLQ